MLQETVINCFWKGIGEHFMAKLNLQDFIELTGKTSITDWVKYNWLGVSYGPGPGPEPLPNPIIIDFLEYPIGIQDESGNDIYPIPYDFGPYVTATGTDTGAQIRAQNNTYDGKTYDRGLRLYGTGRTFTLHVPEGYTQAEFIVESTANKQMYFNDTQVYTFYKTAVGESQISPKLDLTAYGSDIAIRMSSSLSLLEIRLYQPSIDPFILNADSFAIGAISEGTTHGNDYGTIQFIGTGNTVRSRSRTYTGPDETKNWAQSFKNLKANKNKAANNTKRTNLLNTAK